MGIYCWTSVRLLYVFFIQLLSSISLFCLSLSKFVNDFAPLDSLSLFYSMVVKIMVISVHGKTAHYLCALSEVDNLITLRCFFCTSRTFHFVNTIADFFRQSMRQLSVVHGLEFSWLWIMISINYFIKIYNVIAICKVFLNNN